MHTIRPLAYPEISTACVLIAKAFSAKDGKVPERYQPHNIVPRLLMQWQGHKEPGCPQYLIAEVDGQIVAIGGYARSRFGASTWELLLGATLPAFQGRGIGHALVLARLEAIRSEAAGGGLVMVSTKRPARFLRYGFQAGPVNPETGATLMWAPVAASGRAAA
jgi:GNAT superfamily N-acetyltransferase